MDPQTEAERALVEGSILWWMPGVDMQLSSDAPSVAGTTLDVTRELGVRRKGFPEVSLIGRLARRHRIRFQYIPIGYSGTAALVRPVTFSGSVYPAGERVTTTVDWTAYRVGYEFHFLVRENWWLGIVGEIKQTDIRARLTSPASSQTRRTQVPVPAIGPVGRVYLGRRLSVTGEITGMAVPDSADRHYGGHYLDTDIFATATLAPHLAAQIGFRSLDLRHLGESDAAKIKLRGIYAGLVLRVGGRN